MAPIYYDADIEVDVLRGRRIAVIGYGNQGEAQALNLRESGCTVRVGLYPESGSWPRAEGDGFVVQTVAEASHWSDIISILLPDQDHGPVFEESIRKGLEPGKLLIFAHGFSIQYGQVQPPADVDVALVAPVGPGKLMRRLYADGSGIPAVFAVQQNPSGQAEELALAYAAELGCARAGVLRSSFAEETETDLFGEQAVLCGGLSHLIKAGYETLVKAGYQPEVAYFECVHQVKLIVDLIYEGGLAHMHSAVSDTAEYGDYVSGPRVIDAHVKEAMREVLRDIQDGSFATRYMAEYQAGMPSLREKRRDDEQQEIERVGARLRSMMSWVGNGP